MLQALALRYRPRNFDELIGQEAVSRSLIHALDENRLTHAYLFSGLRGSGKTSSARIFSKALVCERGISSKPCEECASCRMANEGRHIDIIEMDAASHRGIDDIKGLIEQTKYAPAMARFKIFIIDEVHMLSTPAFNALLKTLEEPPSYVKFILATTDPLKLPATVLSRTQHFRFKQISKQNIIKQLEFILNNEKIKFDSGSVELLARSGSGSLRDTLTLLDQAIIYSGSELSQTKVADMLGLLDPNKIDEILDLVLNANRAGILAAINELESYDAEMIIDEIIANLKDSFLRQSPKYSLLLYERFFRILSQAKTMLGVSSDNGFVLSVMFFMMIEALNLKNIDEMVAETKAAVGSNLEAKGITVNDTKIQNKSNINQNNLNGQKDISKNQQMNSYELFIAKIYDRDYALGECFERCNKFDSLTSTELRLQYEANDADKQLLRASWGVIQELLRASFNANVKIKTIPLSKPLIEANSVVDEPKIQQEEIANDKNSQSKNLTQTIENDDLDLIDLQKSEDTHKNLEPKFAPDLESMRDDSDDFATAYGVKEEVSLEFLDDELSLIENKKEHGLFDFEGENLDKIDSQKKALNQRATYAKRIAK